MRPDVKIVALTSLQSDNHWHVDIQPRPLENWPGLSVAPIQLDWKLKQLAILRCFQHILPNIRPAPTTHACPPLGSLTGPLQVGCSGHIVVNCKRVPGSILVGGHTRSCQQVMSTKGHLDGNDIFHLLPF